MAKKTTSKQNLKNSHLFHYVCEHGASNKEPCQKCFPGAEPVSDDWYKRNETRSRRGKRA
jgi:hypothetical protein